MKTIRYGVFETNSSSCHSFILNPIKKPSNEYVEKHTIWEGIKEEEKWELKGKKHPYYCTPDVTINFRCFYGRDIMETLTTPNEKLSYAFASYITYNNIRFPAKFYKYFGSINEWINSPYTEHYQDRNWSKYNKFLKVYLSFKKYLKTKNILIDTIEISDTYLGKNKTSNLIVYDTGLDHYKMIGRYLADESCYDILYNIIFNDSYIIMDSDEKIKHSY